MTTDVLPFALVGSHRKPRKTAFPEAFYGRESAGVDHQRGTQRGSKSATQRPGRRR
jgi:hypothetical protein